MILLLILLLALLVLVLFWALAAIPSRNRPSREAGPRAPWTRSDVERLEDWR